MIADCRWNMFGSDLPFFPKQIKEAVSWAASKAVALALAAFSVFSLWTICRGMDNLHTWTRFSTYPKAGFMTNIVDVCVYAVGKIPFAFVAVALLCYALQTILGRRGRADVFAMRVFISATSLSASLAFLAVKRMPGGVIGDMAAYDIARLTAPVPGVVFQTLFLSIFILLAIRIFRITASRLLKLFYWIGFPFVWLVGLFSPRVAAPAGTKSPRRISRLRPAAIVKKRAVSRGAGKGKPHARSRGHKWTLPPPALLERSSFSSAITAAHKQIASSMEDNFNKYRIYGKVRDIQPGPVVTRYDYEPEDGQRINDIIKTQGDMKRAMATEQIRIAVVPRTRYIGVEMANQIRQDVYYQTMMSDAAFADSKMKIPLAMGVGIDGQHFYDDLAKMPHILVAGHTGTGKSVFVQSIITSIVYRNTPNDVRLIIVDPKGVDFMKWQHIPHLLTPIVTDIPTSINALRWAVDEMERRYRELQTRGVQKIEDYNAKVERMIAAGKTIKKKVLVGTDDEGNLEYETVEAPPEKMPYIVMIMDEIADLMAQARKEVETYIQRITQKARAAGIHLVAATQRPSTDIITGVIKSNIPSRISFHTASYVDSMTCLDQRGAEMLLAYGDMLYSQSGKPAVRIHSAYISDKEMDRIARFLRAQGEPEYDEKIIENVAQPGGVPGLPPSRDDQNNDDYVQALEVCRRDNRISIGHIQTRLQFGYGRAKRAFMMMEDNGVIRRGLNGKYEFA